MKTKIVLLALSSILAMSACGKKSSSTAASNTPTDTPATPKATLSSWSIKPYGAWSARLDVNANLSGTPFTLLYKFADTSEITCTATMTGSEASGTLSTSACAVGGAVGSMADQTGTSFAETGGTGSYSNDGSTLLLCRASTTCNDYE